MAQKILVAGSITDEAGAFLLAHGAQITGCLDLTLITLQDDAVVEKQDQLGHYLIAMWTVDEEIEDDVLIVDLAPNAYETKVTLHKDHWATA